MDRRLRANTADPEVRLQQQIVEELQKRREKALLNLLKNPDFLVYWGWMMERTNVEFEQFHGNSRDIFEKGRRSVGLQMAADLVQFNEVGVQFRYNADMQRINDRKQILANLLDKEKGGN